MTVNGAMRVAVEHSYYGCESGCCGHVAVYYDDAGKELSRGGFEFAHPSFWNAGERRYLRGAEREEAERAWVAHFCRHDVALGLTVDFEKCAVSDD